MTDATPQAALLMSAQNPLLKRCYTMSESHLSGYRVVIGFERLEDAQDAHEYIAKLQAAQEPVQAGELPDERAAFEQWWRQRQLLTFPNYYAQSRLADWGDAYKPAAKDAWQARAALSARKPFTNAQIERLFYNSNRGNGCASLAAFVRVVRLVESAHGIGLEVKP